MQPIRIFALLIAFAGLAIVTPAAHAQGGRCSNNNINLAFNTALHRAPNGSGTSGECNPVNYGGGAWSNQADLVKRVGAAVYCSNNLWIGQIYLYDYNRYPTWNECTANYGANSSYMQLDSAIRAYVAGGEGLKILKAPVPGQYLVKPDLSLVDSNGTTVATPNSYVIAAGGANIIVPQAGMVIAAGGANLAAQRSVMSAGKRVITATVVHQ